MRKKNPTQIKQIAATEIGFPPIYHKIWLYLAVELYNNNIIEWRGSISNARKAAYDRNAYDPAQG